MNLNCAISESYFVIVREYTYTLNCRVVLPCSASVRSNWVICSGSVVARAARPVIALAYAVAARTAVPAYTDVKRMLVTSSVLFGMPNSAIGLCSDVEG